MATRIPRRYVITGTPLLSREVEMHTLLRMTGHPLGKLPLRDFSKRFAGTKEKRAELALQLKGWMLRRRKDVLSDLGTKSRQVRFILDSYQSIYADMSLLVMPKIIKLRQALDRDNASLSISLGLGLCLRCLFSNFVLEKSHAQQRNPLEPLQSAR
ncbi:MAG: SNF2-related protein [Rhodoferax sp.]|nr:SNF2-related protein [Rhodoferax sp.]